MSPNNPFSEKSNILPSTGIIISQHNTQSYFKPLKCIGNPFFSKSHCDYFIYQTNNFFPLWYLNPLNPVYFLVYCWNKYLTSAFYYLSHASGNLQDETRLLQRYRTTQCSIVVKTSKDNVFESFFREKNISNTSDVCTFKRK